MISIYIILQNEIKVIQKGRRFLDVLSNSFGPFF